MRNPFALLTSALLALTVFAADQPTPPTAHTSGNIEG